MIPIIVSHRTYLGEESGDEEEEYLDIGEVLADERIITLISSISITESI